MTRSQAGETKYITAKKVMIAVQMEKVSKTEKGAIGAAICRRAATVV